MKINIGEKYTSIVILLEYTTIALLFLSIIFLGYVSFVGKNVVILFAAGVVLILGILGYFKTQLYLKRIRWVTNYKTEVLKWK